MSADELAEVTGMSRQHLDALESGHLDPTYELLLALSEGLGIQPSDLVTLAERLKASKAP
jgi:transcriptional regulator with XRE-family HTH domain